jgi:hypothetical protein
MMKASSNSIAHAHGDKQNPLKIQGFQFRQVLSENAVNTFYRGLLEKTMQPVIVKAPRSGFLTAEATREFAEGTAGDLQLPGIVKFVGFETFGHYELPVMELTFDTHFYGFWYIF